MCLVDIAATPYGPLLPPVSALSISPDSPAALFLVRPFAFEAGATTGNNGRSHSSSHRPPCPGLRSDSTTLHGSAAKPKLTGEEEEGQEEEEETVTREEGIWSHQGESQHAWVYD